MAGGRSTGRESGALAGQSQLIMRKWKSTADGQHRSTTATDTPFRIAKKIAGKESVKITPVKNQTTNDTETRSPKKGTETRIEAGELKPRVTKAS
jgi:hypothetical protein